jgi:hypothetical protein
MTRIDSTQRLNGLDRAKLGLLAGDDRLAISASLTRWEAALRDGLTVYANASCSPPTPTPTRSRST